MSASPTYERDLERAAAFFVSSTVGADEAAADIGAMLERVELRGGETLFHFGDAGDSVYVIVVGRVRVLAEVDGQQVALSELGPGQAVGEMALVTGEPRQATVVAIRDTILYRLQREQFDELLETNPGAMRRTLTDMAKRMNRPAIVGLHALQPTNIVMVAAGADAPLAPFAKALTSFLSGHASVLQLDRELIDNRLGSGTADAPAGSAGAQKLVSMMSDAEEQHEFVLYVADPDLSEWTRRTLRQADLVLTVGDARAKVELNDVERWLYSGEGGLVRKHLVLVQPYQDRSPVGTRRWLAERDVAMVHHLHLEKSSHFSRLARLLIGKPVGLVLSGGSARAFAHIGVLRALREADIPVDIIVGTSAGALIGAQFAQGWDDTRLAEENVSLFSNSRRLLDFTIPYTSIISTQRFNGVLDQVFGDRRFEDLWIQFLCTTTDMTAAELRTHRRGEISRAVRASCSLPMLMPPVVEDGRLLADGGIMNNVPVDQLLAVANVGSLIVVNVANPFYTADEDYNYRNSLPFWRVFNGRFNPFAANLVAPSIASVLMRSLEIGTKSLERAQIAKADVYVRPELTGMGYGTKRLPEIIEAGYVAATAELADWRPEIPFR